MYISHTQVYEPGSRTYQESVDIQVGAEPHPAENLCWILELGLIIPLMRETLNLAYRLGHGTEAKGAMPSPALEVVVVGMHTQIFG